VRKHRTPTIKAAKKAAAFMIDCAWIVPEDVGSGDLSDFVDSGISNLRVSNTG
jgi:hypothetical protein